jgi:VIT1/CCC1 family predicted Fe2+/Mn2+ transporter
MFTRDRLIYKDKEKHYVNRSSWLRAAVLGANDGIISVSSLVIGVATAAVGSKEILIAGVAGLVSGAMSMAAGEYVSVSSQADLEQADLSREKQELKETPENELDELANIYILRGVEKNLAREVAKQMMAKDALQVHVRDELGITEITAAKPLQAAFASAFSFTCGASAPLISIFAFPREYFVIATSLTCILLLGILGSMAAKIGGAKILVPALRVMFWGAAAMGFTALIGSFLGVQL